VSDIATIEAHLRSHPDDLDSWLVYADHLLEHGDDRGELIMLRHKLTHAPSEDLETRARHAESFLRKALEQRLHPYMDWRIQRWHHGFLYEVGMSWGGYFVEALRRLREGQPFLASLDLREGCPREGLSEILRSGLLAGLSELDLGFNDLGSSVIQKLARSESVTSLRKLGLFNNHLGAEGARALARSKMLSSLVSLDLQLNHIGDNGAHAIACSKTLRSLTELDLAHNGISHRGAASLARSRTLASLQRLDLSGNPLGDEGIAELEHRGVRVIR
jgi:uncharacterized protein (TIGR02996 family)